MTNAPFEAVVKLCENLNREKEGIMLPDKDQAAIKEDAYKILAEWRANLPESDSSNAGPCSKCPIAN